MYFLRTMQTLNDSVRHGNLTATGAAAFEILWILSEIYFGTRKAQRTFWVVIGYEIRIGHLASPSIPECKSDGSAGSIRLCDALTAFASGLGFRRADVILQRRSRRCQPQSASGMNPFRGDHNAVGVSPSFRRTHNKWRSLLARS